MGLSDRHSWASATPLTGSSDRHSRAQATATHGLKRPPLTGSSDRHSRAYWSRLLGGLRDLLGAKKRYCAYTVSFLCRKGLVVRAPACAETRRFAWPKRRMGRSVAWAEASHGPNSALACSLTGTWRASEVLSWTAIARPNQRVRLSATMRATRTGLGRPFKRASKCSEMLKLSSQPERSASSANWPSSTTSPGPEAPWRRAAMFTVWPK